MDGADGRDFDVVLWGATGFTGRLLAGSVASAAPPGLRWAVGGRDRQRLEALRAELGGVCGVVVGDAHDDAAMAAVARRTRVVASTVGPYALHGTPLVAACVAAGTHYADITGETTWMRRSIESFHAAAHHGGTRIVHACGFDSVPSDLGAWALQRAAIALYGRPCRTIRHVVGAMAGGISGGTAATMLAMAAAAVADPAVRRQLADPDLLAPGAPPTPPDPDPWWPVRDPDLDRWTAPFPMGAVNERVVRRTRALLGEPWGHDVRYRERWAVRGWARAAALGAGMALAPALLGVAPLRRLAERRWLPRPGEGPDAATRARGFFRSTLFGRIDGVEAPLVLRVGIDLDPGYGATAVMLREAAFGLALDRDGGPGGVLTPAAAFGDRLLGRLRRAGMRFDVEPPAGR